MKKKFIVPNIANTLNENLGFKKKLKAINYHNINLYNWGYDGENRKVRFKIAHNNTSLYLHYDVIEPQMMAKYFENNDPIHKDSCVEFFVALHGQPNYYNFEFNCLGSCHAAWGKDRFERKLIDEKIINLIKIKTEIKKIKKNDNFLFNWKIYIKIPLEAFSFSDLKSLENTRATANFYKCGDDLPQPHFMSWNPITSEKPDFHLKSFFGEIAFE